MNLDDPDGFQPGVSGTGWLVTFTDCVSLMLTFFVLLFAMSHVGVGKWEKMSDALSQTFNPSHEAGEATTARHSIATVFRRRAVNLDYLAVVFEETIGADPFLKPCRVTRLDDRLVISLPGELLFDSDGAVLSERARQAVFDIGGMLRSIRNQVVVNGYLDGGPRAGGYASGWELSVARAIAVANALKRSGYDQEVLALGHADGNAAGRPGLPADQNGALARRVDVVILPEAADR